MSLNRKRLMIYIQVNVKPCPLSNFWIKKAHLSRLMVLEKAYANPVTFHVRWCEREIVGN